MALLPVVCTLVQYTLMRAQSFTGHMMCSFVHCACLNMCMPVHRSSSTCHVHPCASTSSRGVALLHPVRVVCTLVHSAYVVILCYVYPCSMCTGHVVSLLQVVRLCTLAFSRCVHPWVVHILCTRVRRSM